MAWDFEKFEKVEEKIDLQTLWILIYLTARGRPAADFDAVVAAAVGAIWCVLGNKNFYSEVISKDEYYYTENLT